MRQAYPRISPIEYVFALAALLLMLGALRWLFVDYSAVHLGSSDRTEGNAEYQLVTAFLYLVISVVIFTRLKQVLWLCFHNKVLVLLIAMVVLSALWSTHPEITLRRSVALLGTTLLAFYLVLRFPPEELLVLLAIAFGLAAAMCLFMIFVYPDIGIHQWGNHVGTWRGVFPHKNFMGRTMVLGAVVFWLVAQQRNLLGPLAWGGLFLCAFLAIMSSSRTAWVSMFLMFVLIFPLRMLRQGRTSIAFRLILVLALFGVGGLMLLLSFYEEALALIGRNEGLSSRTTIWALAWEWGLKRPWLGYGYDIFWAEENAGRLLSFLHFDIGHAHSAFVDLWLDLGFAGVAVFLATLAIAVRRAMSRLTTSHDAVGLWYPMFLAFMLLTSITEAAILKHGRIEWVLYVTTMLYLSLEQPRRVPAPMPVPMAASIR